LCNILGWNALRRDYYEFSGKLKDQGGSGMDGKSAKYSPQMQEAIRRRATEIYRRGGEAEGHDVENWFKAEAEILRETAGHLAHPAVVINVKGVVYTGEYDVATSDGYRPGEWKAGDRVTVRLQGERLFLRRPNGRELQTNVVKRIG
jgi:hypothetical protein